jgi:serine/threonine-protein kinase
MLDVIAVDEGLFLVLEYCHGEPVSRLLRSAEDGDSPAPLDVVSSIVCGVLHGLHAAHEATNERGEPLELVHRDVSPQNILVGVDGVARVIDFGVAKAVGRSHTTSDGKVRGKLAYMAPEQLRGERVDRRADLYSAGVVLWEMLTGRPLFKGDNEAATIANVLYHHPPRPSSLRPELSREVDELTARALARQRVGRFETARQMALALEQCVPPATPARVGMWVDSIAGGVLAKRSAVIARIEEGLATSQGDGARSKQRSSPLVLDSTSSQIFSRSNVHFPSSRSRTSAAWALAGAVVLATGSALWGVASRTRRAHDVQPERLDVAAAVARLAASSAATPPVPAAAPSESEPPPGRVVSPPVAPPPVRESGHKAKPSVRSSASAPAQPLPSASCTVRSYFDREGIKQYEQVCP